MKQKQVNRNLALATLIAMFICMSMITAANAQVTPRRGESGKKYHQRLQAENNWEHYRSTWMKIEVKVAREKASIKKERAVAARRNAKKMARLNRIKNR